MDISELRNAITKKRHDLVTRSIILSGAHDLTDNDAMKEINAQADILGALLDYIDGNKNSFIYYK